MWRWIAIGLAVVLVVVVVAFVRFISNTVRFPPWE
jgi:hypothetical protein